MLAETLREWDEQKIAEGRRKGLRTSRREGLQEGRQEGRRQGRRQRRQEGQREVLAQERALLCSQASLRFGAATGTELAAILSGVEDGVELARVGTLIVGCSSGSDLLARARRR